MSLADDIKQTALQLGFDLVGITDAAPIDRHHTAALRQWLDAGFAGQMQYTYFPISVEQFEARVNFHDLVEGSFEIDGLRVTARYLNHPALTLGYRLEEDGAALVYATDHEPHARETALGAPQAWSREDEQHARFVAGADLLIHDAQYTAAEYPRFAGWGHSPVEFVVDLACAAIRSGTYTREEALGFIEAARLWAVTLCPDRLDLFDMIYARRMQRLIEEYARE